MNLSIALSREHESIMKRLGIRSANTSIAISRVQSIRLQVLAVIDIEDDFRYKQCLRQSYQTEKKNQYIISTIQLQQYGFVLYTGLCHYRVVGLINFSEILESNITWSQIQNVIRKKKKNIEKKRQEIFFAISRFRTRTSGLQ